MNRWLKKLENAPGSELTHLTKGGSVSPVSAPTGTFEENNASGNRWLAKLDKAHRHLEEVPLAPAPTVTGDSPLATVAAPDPAEPKGAPAPLQEGRGGMSRWLKNLGKPHGDELTQLTKGGYVSSVSVPTGVSEENNASGNRWLAMLDKAPKRAPAPLQEVERIIEVLSQEVGHDLGPNLENLMRRAMGPLDRGTRAELAAEIDDAFESAQGIEQAREQAAQAIRGKVGDPPPVALSDWLAWIEARCPINADDRHHLTDRLKWLAPAKLATSCRWYAQAWAKAAADEPKTHRRENAGRRAANASLLAPRAATLAKAAHHPRQQQNGAPEPLPAGVRMSWTLRVDGRRLAIAGRPMTEEEALASARARWPGANLEVLTDAD